MSGLENSLNVSIKSDFKEIFQADSLKNLNENVQTSLALAAFLEKRVTLARAAELADKSLSDFIKILMRYNIPWMEYTEESMQQDEETLDYLRGLASND